MENTKLVEGGEGEKRRAKKEVGEEDRRLEGKFIAFPGSYLSIYWRSGVSKHSANTVNTAIVGGPQAASHGTVLNKSFRIKMFVN